MREVDRMGEKVGSQEGMVLQCYKKVNTDIQRHAAECKKQSCTRIRQKIPKPNRVPLED